ncbi:type IV toxin-antitoxin system AbiEi family antitoxin domain-containing protein [Phytoactinopolyspora halotolerans]|uniref:Type IV toxin-antitoxin system AbiEi family antitoxin domain-containing protein n=1 Tax=Phytoactinopolyspora halotolerans TaxID=1981512 RepID=A0A6L9SGU8_9ACTN|nr:type IV toxin-antitoxin system AbiEi family antitoxin domain-containing protein [Phytoactinopolyspora halotolerans]NEE04419.1 type IV toxin-antitoxin system AbiEi family antitoxin domain-containing protein [Phytoactinopolyspora halotolerans]
MPSRIRRLPGEVEQLLAAGRGLVSVQAAADAGIDRGRIARLRRGGFLIRLAYGMYASREAYEAMPPWPAFALRSRAFTLACGPAAYAAGWSAVAIHELPAIGPPPDLPSVVVPRGAAASGDFVFGRVRSVLLPLEHRDEVGGCGVVSVPRAVVDVGRTAPRDQALVLADAAIALRTGRDELRAVLAGMHGWPGSAEARWAVEHADPYSESALETLGRLTFIEHGLPVPVSNPWIDLGAVRFRADHLLDDRWLVFEGDGDLKYNVRLDAAHIIRQQREREWRLREAGFEVVRYGWDMARDRRATLADRFRQVIADRAPRDRPYPWYRERGVYRHTRSSPG